MVRSLCELEWGKGERRGWGSLDQAACEQRGPKGKERGGARYGDESENREPTRVPGSEGRTVRQDKASAAQRCGHVRAAHVGPTTDSVRRAHSDGDPACVALSNRSQERRRVGQCNFSDLRAANFPVVFLFLLFPFFKNLFTPVTLIEHNSINPLWISRLNTWIFLPKRIFIARTVPRCNSVTTLGQQPRYQRAPSSVTMWQLFHRWPSVPSRHHKLLTRQLLPTYLQ